MSACYVILAHVTWALAREWALFIRAAKTVTWALTQEWALARDTTVNTMVSFKKNADHKPTVFMLSGSFLERH